MKLLVSVRSVAEARQALAAGVDLLDIKEPSVGALGAADADVIADICELARGQSPVSAALGELRDFRAAMCKSLDPGALQYAKIGLAGMASRHGWLDQWQAFAESIPTNTQPVAVAYADADLAQSPSIDSVASHAIDMGWPAFLIDTFDKQAGGLFDHVTVEHLTEIIERLHAADVLVVLAGSLRHESLAVIGHLSIRPDFVAVRGAVCRDHRESPLDATKISEFRNQLRETSTARAAN